MEIPVALFAYARPDHLKRTLSSLRQNKVTLLYIFSDAPRTPDKAEKVDQVRIILREIDWCKVVLCERKYNLGLGRSILTGVTDVLRKHDACIVLEDDLICVPGTFEYLSTALKKYQNNTNVMSVTGWTHPSITPTDVETTPYFDGRAECWVWGTWSRAWSGMNDQTAQEMMLKAEILGVDRNSYGFDLPKMAETELERNIWAVRFLYFHILNKGLCLRPPWSMVEHIGFDDLATNARDSNQLTNGELLSCPSIPIVWPEAVEKIECKVLHCQLTIELPQKKQLKVLNLIKRIVRRLNLKRKITFKKILKELLPPILKKLILYFKKNKEKYDLNGEYSNWSEAKLESEGYDVQNILNKTADAVLKVKNGKAVYERDSVLFDDIEYSWPILAGLMWSASQSKGELNVIDYGGSLGSTYYQNRKFLKKVSNVRWNVIEQPEHVKLGRSKFQDEYLKFYESIEECVKETVPNVILLSSVIQYLEDPYKLIDELADTNCKILIIDRTPFWSGNSDRIFVQNVPVEIYEASYPSWVFSEKRFLSILSLNWNIVEKFISIDKLTSAINIEHKGLIAIRKY
jgi:putative methyltransferase (TIGR04325 family)